MKPSGIGVGLMLLGAMRTSFQQNRDNGMVSVPNRFVLDPHTVANVLENMIHRKKHTVILPAWMMLALKLKHLFG